MKKIIFFLVFFIICITFWGCSKTGYNAATGLPAPGSARIVSGQIEYYSAKVEGSNAWATWPVAKFKADPRATRYVVKELKSGKTYTWLKGNKTEAAYNVMPQTNNLKAGFYYIGLGRTWCADCDKADAAWEENYRNNVYAVNDKVEITFYY